MTYEEMMMDRLEEFRIEGLEESEDEGAIGEIEWEIDSILDDYEEEDEISDKNVKRLRRLVERGYEAGACVERAEEFLEGID